MPGRLVVSGPYKTLIPFTTQPTQSTTVSPPYNTNFPSPPSPQNTAQPSSTTPHSPPFYCSQSSLLTSITCRSQRCPFCAGHTGS